MLRKLLPVWFVLSLAALVAWLWWRRQAREMAMRSGRPEFQPAPDRSASRTLVLSEGVSRRPVPAPAAASTGAPAADQPAAPTGDRPPQTEPRPAAPPSSPPDDLKRIQGIGPRISAVLVGVGISTFAQLAGAAPLYLKQILEQAGIRLADTGTWPEQAALAAAGDWAALAELQSQLKGGRRV